MKKNFIFLLFFTFFSLTGIAQDKSYQLSSHILDIHTGKPAPGVTISLSRQDTSGRWSVIEERKTDENGRVKDFLEATPEGHPGIYKLTYQVGPYFEAQGQDSFYPFIEVVFQIKDNAHYHVPNHALTLRLFHLPGELMGMILRQVCLPGLWGL